MKTFYLLVFFLTFCFLNLNAQNATIEQLQKKQTTLENKKHTIQYQKTLFDLGLAYEGIDIQKTTQFADELKKCQYEEVKSFAQVRGYILEAINSLNKGKPSLAFSASNNALDLAKSNQDSLGMGIAHLYLAIYYSMNYQIDSLGVNSEKAVSILKKLDKEWAIQAQMKRTLYWSFKGDLQKRINTLDSLSQLSIVQKNSFLQFKINLKLALAHATNADFHKGSISLHQADLFLKKNRYPKYLIEFFTIQSDYFWKSQPEKSIETSNKGLALAKKSGFKYKELVICNFLGFYYRGMEDFEKSESLLKQNMAYCNQEKVNNLYTVAWLFLAKNYTERGEKGLAIETLLDLLKFCEKNDIFSVLPSILSYFSELTVLGENTKIDQIFEKYSGVEDKFSSTFNKHRLLKIAQKRAEKNGEHLKALEIANRRIESLDELAEVNNSSKYIELEAAYRNEIMQNEIENQNKIIEINDTHRKILIGSCSILLLSILFSSYLIYRRKQYLAELKNQNQSLQNQKQEISSLNLELSKKNEVLGTQYKIQGQDLFEYILMSEKREEQISSLEKIFKKVKANLTRSNNQDVKILERKIDEIKLESDDWVAFKQKFNQLHPNFINNIITKHPTLTKRELKHCIFLKLNLPSKKIAEIMFISPKSVETARYRIKKKLELSSKDSMKDYLNAIS